MIPNRFYRYRKLYRGDGRLDLKVGNTYLFKEEIDSVSEFRKKFIWFDAFGQPFDLRCSYAELDNIRMEDFFEEVSKPSWWDSPGEPTGF